MGQEGTADDRPTVDVTTDESTGSGWAHIEEGEPVDGSARMIETESEGDTYLACRAQFFDDEPGFVAASVTFPNVDGSLKLSPDRAREFAAELEAAADHAEQGAAELGDDTTDDAEAAATYGSGDTLRVDVAELRALADRAPADRWRYAAVKSDGIIETPVFRTELDALDTALSGSVETFPVTGPNVPLSIEIGAGEDVSVSTMVHLTPDDAEALAVDLLGQASDARDDDE